MDQLLELRPLPRGIWEHGPIWGLLLDFKFWVICCFRFPSQKQKTGAVFRNKLQWISETTLQLISDANCTGFQKQLGGDFTNKLEQIFIGCSELRDCGASFILSFFSVRLYQFQDLATVCQSELVAVMSGAVVVMSGADSANS